MRTHDGFPGEHQPAGEGAPEEVLVDYLHGLFEDALKNRASTEEREYSPNSQFVQDVILPIQNALEEDTFRIVLVPPHPYQYKGSIWEVFIPRSQVVEADGLFFVGGHMYLREATAEGPGRLEIVDERGVSAVEASGELTVDDLTAETGSTMHKRTMKVLQAVSECNIAAIAGEPDDESSENEE